MSTNSLPPGSVVRMSQRLKDEMTALGSGDHVAEFGERLGIVAGPVDFGGQLGPEVDVRWLPEELRYGYAPERLVRVPLVIAVDGPAASGKGTLARRIAAYFNLAYLDTGALYRGVARDCLQRGLALDDTSAVVNIARALEPESLSDPGLRAPGIGEAASRVAGIPHVRAALLEYQRAFAANAPGAVLDGRDIGTVVCPDADAKLFVTAKPEVRADRRHRERLGQGEDISYEQVLQLIKDRDARDQGREAAPMKVAADADLLDTTEMDIPTALDAAVRAIKRKIGQPGRRPKAAS